MCDYSLAHIASRPASVGEKLTSSRFIASSSRGFSSPTDAETAVCVLPGTEVAFEQPVVFKSDEYGMQDYWSMGYSTRPAQAATFRQVNLDNQFTHHDALELVDGEIVMLNNLEPGQVVTVLQMPVAPKTAAEAEAQKRAEVVA